MKANGLLVAGGATLGIAFGPQHAFGEARQGVERLNIIDCGHSVGPDKSRWPPGVDVGKPVEVVGNCYLVRHRQGWLLWGTGVTDAVAKMPGGRPGQRGSPHWYRPKTLAGELEKLGMKPADISLPTSALPTCWRTTRRSSG